MFEAGIDRFGGEIPDTRENFSIFAPWLVTQSSQIVVRTNVETAPPGSWSGGATSDRRTARRGDRRCTDRRTRRDAPRRRAREAAATLAQPEVARATPDRMIAPQRRDVSAGRPGRGGTPARGT